MKWEKNERYLTSALAIHVNLIIHLYSGGDEVCEAEGHNAHARRFLAGITVSVQMLPFRHLYIHATLISSSFLPWLSSHAKASFLKYFPCAHQSLNFVLVHSSVRSAVRAEWSERATAKKKGVSCSRLRQQTIKCDAVMLSNVCQFIHRFSKSTERFSVKSIIRSLSQCDVEPRRHRMPNG